MNMTAPPKEKKKVNSPKKTARCENMTPAVHRLVLKFLNQAVRSEDLMYGMPITAHIHPKVEHLEHFEDHQEVSFDVQIQLFLQEQVWVQS